MELNIQACDHDLFFENITQIAYFPLTNETIAQRSFAAKPWTKVELGDVSSKYEISVSNVAYIDLRIYRVCQRPVDKTERKYNRQLSRALSGQ
jgi:hypothetical protein